MPDFEIETTDILKKGSVSAVKNLLGLYSLTTLKNRWEGKGTSKSDIATQVILEKDYDAIAHFLFDRLTTCKQHNYVYKHKHKKATFPGIKMLNAERIGSEKGENSDIIFYIAEVEYDVILWNPRGEETVKLLMPFCIEILDNYLLLKFVTFEKDLVTYFGHKNHHITKRSKDEANFISWLDEAALKSNIDLKRADLHKGVKTLIDDKLIAPKKAKIEKDNRTTIEEMNGDLDMTVDEALYQQFKENPVHNSIFKCKIPDEEFSIKHFSADPSDGKIDFSTYSERKGDTDYVIKEILRRN